MTFSCKLLHKFKTNTEFSVVIFPNANDNPHLLSQYSNYQ